MLDRYRGWHVKDEARKLVEAEAGIHLGADPSDPTGTATLETSLLSQLATQKRLDARQHRRRDPSDRQRVHRHRVVRRVAAVHAPTATCYGVPADRRARRDPRAHARRRRPRRVLLDVAEPRAARRRVDDHVRVHGPVRDRGRGGGDHARRLPRRPARAGSGRAAVARAVPARRGVLAARVVAAARRRAGRHVAGVADRGAARLPAEAVQALRRQPRGDPADDRDPLHDPRQPRRPLEGQAEARGQLRRSSSASLEALPFVHGPGRRRPPARRVPQPGRSSSASTPRSPRSSPFRRLAAQGAPGLPAEADRRVHPARLRQGRRPAAALHRLGWSGLPMDNQADDELCRPSSPRRGCRCRARAR